MRWAALAAAAGLAAWGLAAWGLAAWGLAAWGLAAGGLAAWGLAAGGLAAGGLEAGGLAAGGLAAGGLAAWGLAAGGLPFADAWVATAPVRTRRGPPLSMGRASVVRANTKAKTDAHKASVHNTFAKRIIMAVKRGGADLTVNRALAQLLDEAKAARVPKEIIQRNIDKATAPDTRDYHESLFELYGEGGAGLLVTVLTDNDHRAAADVTSVARKHGLKLAATNAVAFQFESRAQLFVRGTVDEAAAVDWCLEAGVQDIRLAPAARDPDSPVATALLVPPADLAKTRAALLDRGLEVLQAALVQVPRGGPVTQADDVLRRNLEALAALRALPDVAVVQHNLQLDGAGSAQS